MRVALVHDYLNQAGGAEKVMEVFCRMFPGSPVYTALYDPAAMPDFWRTQDVRTSFMQRLAPRLSVGKALFPLYPLAFESFDLRDYDLVLSSTTTFAKGVITRPDTCHVCYCNTPTRFAWMYHDYTERQRMGRMARRVLPTLISPLRVWDYAAAQRVDSFVAGSYNAARRIQKYYRRSCTVVQSPIEVRRFVVAPQQEINDYFLMVSRLVSYKRVDLAIEACNRLRLPLHVVGDGPDAARLRQMAGPTVRMLGRLSDDDTRDQLSHCRALLFPGEEDFGLTPLEAQASGRPVIAYGAGGALETIVEGETGLFFAEQTVDALANLLATFDTSQFIPQAARQNAERFDESVFMQRMHTVIAASVHQQRQDWEAAGRTAGNLRQ